MAYVERVVSTAGVGFDVPFHLSMYELGVPVAERFCCGFTGYTILSISSLPSRAVRCRSKSKICLNLVGGSMLLVNTVEEFSF